MSTFFVIHHRDKAGCAEKQAEYGAKKQNAEFNDEEAKLWDAAGFHAHNIMIGTGQVFCVWEAQKGKTAQDMQAHIDAEMPFLNNVVYTVEASVNGFKPKNFFGDDATPHRLADFPLLGEFGCKTTSSFYMVEHFAKPGMVDTWLKMTEGFDQKTIEGNAGNEELTKLLEQCAELGFHGHSSIPVCKRDGHVFCLWEVRMGKTAADMQAFHDGNMGNGGPQLMTNILHPIDLSYSQGVYPSFGM